MKVYELYKPTLQQQYHGNIETMIKDEMYILWDEERIKRAFNFGNGTIKEFNRYMEANKNLCLYIKL